MAHAEKRLIVSENLAGEVLAPRADPAPYRKTHQDGEGVKMFTAMGAGGAGNAVRDFQECRGAR